MTRSPRLSGVALRAAVRVVRSKVGALTLPALYRKELKIDDLRALPEDLRGPLQNDVMPIAGRPPRAPEDPHLPLPAPPWSGTSATIAASYRSGEATPSDAVANALRAARGLASRTPPMGPIFAYADDTVREEAEEATKRWKSGHPRGSLDGVPTVIKEEMRVRGFAWSFGSDLSDMTPATDDATSTARVRDTGALILGLSSMTEYGMTPTGVNPKRRMPKNPHATDCAAGGSSTGTAVAVATGLVPFGLGADGGGSIRTPAALTGIFGIKPTWGRISREGASSGTVAHVGPLASSTLDLARVLDVLSGPDPLDRETRWAPATEFQQFERALGRGVRGLVIGVLEDEWSRATPVVTATCKEALAALEKEGARIVRLAIPLARYAPAIGYVSIATEARAILSREWRERADDMTLDLQMTFATLDTLTGPDVFEAMRLRSGLRREVARAFGEVDLIAMPTTASTAPRINEAEMKSGLLDAQLLDELCRFAFLGNLTGLPASTAPVGRDADDRPIGFQLVGDAWDEATVLAATAHLERIGAARIARPKVTA
jgi:aspartyl-tRNA(Asn)/glutamyl-tRNA(Gln) amidotransferase subunit A